MSINLRGFINLNTEGRPIDLAIRILPWSDVGPLWKFPLIWGGLLIRGKGYPVFLSRRLARRLKIHCILVYVS